MNEMTSQLKALIHENASLTNTNNSLSESVTALSNLEVDRQQLSRELDGLTGRLNELESSNKSLTAVKELRQHELAVQNRRCDQLKHENVPYSRLPFLISSIEKLFRPTT